MQENFQRKLDNIKSQLSSWKHVTLEEVQFKRMAGITNITSSVTTTNEQATPKKIIYRQFCSAETSVFLRDEELFVFDEMARHNLGAQNLGTDQKEFRLESWIESQHPSIELMCSRQFRLNFAYKLNNFHKIQIEKIQNDKPVEQFIFGARLQNLLHQKLQKIELFSQEELKMIKEIQTIQLQSEVEWLKKQIYCSKLPYVFSHNDPLLNNIFVTPSDDNNYFLNIQLIDFEFSSYNLEMFDLAAHFSECLYDYEKPTYPFFGYMPQNKLKEEDIIELVKYSIVFKKEIDKQIAVTLMESPEKFQLFIDQNFNQQEFNVNVQDALFDFKVSVLVHAYYWALESLVVSKNPENQFCYVEFAYQKYLNYLEFKQQWF